MESCTLRRWVTLPALRAQRSPGAKVAVARGMCEGLRYLHNDATIVAERGVIHRDLKPENVLLARGDPWPTPKLIDFGEAKAQENTVTCSVAIGTIGWQAPEQMMQEPCTKRSDVFSLGLVLFFLVTDGKHALDPPRMHQVHLATLGFPAGVGAVAL